MYRNLSIYRLCKADVPIEGEYLISKRRYSAFFWYGSGNFAERTPSRYALPDWCLTDVCIHYTAVDAHQHDYHIRVVTDAVAGSSEEAHKYALKAMKYLQRDALITVSDLENCE